MQSVTGWDRVIVAVRSELGLCALAILSFTAFSFPMALTWPQSAQMMLVGALFLGLILLISALLRKPQQQARENPTHRRLGIRSALPVLALAFGAASGLATGILKGVSPESQLSEPVGTPLHQEMGANRASPIANCKVLADVNKRTSKKDEDKYKDKAYWLGTKEQPYQAWCNMTTDGGGWTLVAKIQKDNSQWRFDSLNWTEPGLNFNFEDFDLNRGEARYPLQ